METMRQIIGNKLFVSAFLGWSIAQILKTLINFIITKKFVWERLIGSGGMPSSHSATVCGLLTATIIEYGIDGFEFPMAFAFAMIVMYDAMNVRMETGKQAIVLNLMLKNEDFISQFKNNSVGNWPKIFKEYV